MAQIDEDRKNKITETFKPFMITRDITELFSHDIFKLQDDEENRDDEEVLDSKTKARIKGLGVFLRDKVQGKIAEEKLLKMAGGRRPITRKQTAARGRRNKKPAVALPKRRGVLEELEEVYPHNQ